MRKCAVGNLPLVVHFSFAEGDRSFDAAADCHIAGIISAIPQRVVVLACEGWEAAVVGACRTFLRHLVVA